MLFKEDFIQSVKKLLDLLNPVAVLIKNFQNSTYSIADATEEWIDLLAEASPELYGTVCDRCDEFTKHALTANFLHPLYREGKLSSDQHNII